MATIIIATALMVGIALAVKFAGKIFPFPMCAICAGVAGTWVLLLGAYALGYPVDLTIPAILMGGSVVGVAYQGEKRLVPERAFLWKLLFIPAGLGAVASVFAGQWVVAGAFGAILLCVALAFFGFSSQRSVASSTQRDLEEKMKNCC